MELFHMIFHILVIFALTIQLIEAGPITPIRNMNSVAMFRPLLTTFRGSVNTGYIPNNQIPLREVNGITYVNPVSATPLGNGANSWFYVNGPTITKGVMAQNPWYPNSSPLPTYNMPTEEPTSSNTPDYDAILAERFPGAIQLLENLKKLNKIKDEQRKKALAAQIFEEEQTKTEKPGYKEPSYKEPSHKEPGHKESGHKESGYIEPGDEDNSQIFKAEIKQQGHGTNMVNGRVVLRKLKKKKFFHQAQPVIPENETTTTKEVVYFIDNY